MRSALLATTFALTSGVVMGPARAHRLPYALQRVDPPAVFAMCEEQRPRTSVYQHLSDEQIADIHQMADALFIVLDRNGDDSVSKTELASHLLLARYTEDAIEKMFSLLDVNSDGTLSQVELREAFVRYPPLRSAPAMGSESSSNELHVEADAVFASLDLNGDGLLSFDELEAHLSGIEGPTYSPEAVQRVFRVLDADGDGKVSPSEFRGGYVSYRALRLALGLRMPELGWNQSPG